MTFKSAGLDTGNCGNSAILLLRRLQSNHAEYDVSDAIYVEQHRWPAKHHRMEDNICC